MFQRWQSLLEERLEESIAALASVPGIRGLILGGSLGRGEAWPMSDIDILPISSSDMDTAPEIERRHTKLINWWASSGRAQCLDVGWLCFTDTEVAQAMDEGPQGAASRMSDVRWFHGLDKAYGGRGVGDPDGLAHRFAQWVTAVRFQPEVTHVRAGQWISAAGTARDGAQEAIAQGDEAEATVLIRESGSALRLVLLEGWGERLGSMGREWTFFERISSDHGARKIADRLAKLCDASSDDIAARIELAPEWLRERIDLCYEARKTIGDPVSIAENARDQVAAFAVHVQKRTPPPWDPWVGAPASDNNARLRVLDQLISEICS